MTHDQPFDEETTSVAAFNEALTQLLRSAHQNGIEVEGGWECRNNGMMPDWEAVIVEMATQEDDDQSGVG